MQVMKFNVQKERKGVEFGIWYADQIVFDPARPMGNVARILLESVLSAAFVDMFAEMRHVIPRCQSWLKGAIDQRENLGSVVEFHMSRLYEALAISRWLLDDTVDEGTWRLALQQEHAAALAEGVYSPRDRKSVRLDDIVPAAILAGELPRAISEYRAALGSGTAKRGAAVKPRKFGYTVALCGEISREDREEVFVWGKKVLHESLDDWLAHGQYMRAAKWVCLIYTVIGGYSSASTALKQSVLDISSESAN